MAFIFQWRDWVHHICFILGNHGNPWYQSHPLRCWAFQDPKATLVFFSWSWLLLLSNLLTPSELTLLGPWFPPKACFMVLWYENLITWQRSQAARLAKLGSPQASNSPLHASALSTAFWCLSWGLLASLEWFSCFLQRTLWYGFWTWYQNCRIQC